MRGLKSKESTKAILEGYTVHYNFVRPHQSLNGKTPAQEAQIDTPSNWKSLIELATQHEANILQKAMKNEPQANKSRTIEVLAR
jgi:hypothetical protein